MKNIFSFLILVLSAVVLACTDGQERTHKSPQEILQENKLLDSFSENIKYIPEKYTETITDTTLSNGFRVKISYFTDMNNSILKETKKDTIHLKEYYRERKTKIIVYKNSKELFNKTFDKTSIFKSYNLQFEEIKDYQLNSVFINQYKSIQNNSISITVSFCTIDTNKCLFYKLSINNKGVSTFNLVENNNNFYH